jgi:hypothetical protein
MQEEVLKLKPGQGKILQNKMNQLPREVHPN